MAVANEMRQTSLPTILIENNTYDQAGVLNVWQNWGSQFMNPNGVVMRVRLYRTSAERRATRCGYAHEVWPKSSPFACWYCRQFFSGPPMMIPRARSPGMVWELEGNFCSGYRGVTCGMKFLMQGPQTFATSTRTALFIQLVKQVFPSFDKHMGGRIPLALDYREYEMFGGDTSVEEARAISLQPDVIMHMKFPPHVNTVIGVSETYFGPLHGGRGEREILKAIATEARQQKMQSGGKKGSRPGSESRPGSGVEEEEKEEDEESEDTRMEDEEEEGTRMSGEEEEGDIDDRTRRRLAAYREQKETFDVEHLHVPSRQEIQDRLAQKPTRLNNVGAFEALAFGGGGEQPATSANTNGSRSTLDLDPAPPPAAAAPAAQPQASTEDLGARQVSKKSRGRKKIVTETTNQA